MLLFLIFSLLLPIDIHAVFFIHPAVLYGQAHAVKHKAVQNFCAIRQIFVDAIREQGFGQSVKRVLLGFAAVIVIMGIWGLAHADALLLQNRKSRHHFERLLAFGHKKKASTLLHQCLFSISALGFCTIPSARSLKNS